MKKIILMAALIAATTAQAQEKQKASFQKLFPSATSVKWEKEGGDYEASFVLNGNKMSAVFDASGNCKETEETITENDIPAKALAYFKAHYKNTPIKETAKITKANKQVQYEIGIKEKDVLFDADGNFIKEAKD